MSSPRTVAIVARKELTDLFRDVRSMVITVAVPIILFPLLFLALNTNIEHQRSLRSSPLAVAVSPETPSTVRTVLEQRYSVVTGGGELVRRGIAVAAVTPGQIVYNNRSETSTVVGTELAAMVNTAGADAAATTAGTTAADENGVAAGTNGDPPADRPTSETRAATRGTVQGGDAFVLRPLYQPDGDPGALLALAAVVPLFILLAATVSTLPAALDLGAGEKQRQSLEFLLATTKRRGSLFLGKWVATTVVGYIGTLAFVTGALIANRAVPDLLGINAATIPFSVTTGVALLATTLLAVIVIAAVELTVSFIARSSREAQLFFLPVLVTVSTAGYTAMAADAWYTPRWIISVPILNIAMLLKSIVVEHVDFLETLWIYGENVGVLLGIALVGRRILASEWVLRRS